jgi:hypothetical protein
MRPLDTETVLDVLGDARESLARGPFSFHDWTECTCGHLYAAAEGASAVRRRSVRLPDPGSNYAAAVVAIAQALSGDDRRFAAHGRRWWQRRSPAALAVRFISDTTLWRAGTARVDRRDAIAVIDDAIAGVRARVPADVHVRRLPA